MLLTQSAAALQALPKLPLVQSPVPQYPELQFDAVSHDDPSAPSEHWPDRHCNVPVQSVESSQKALSAPLAHC
jgi:hypothetical protein